MCDEVSSDECEAKTYARKRYTESQSSIYARSSGSEVVSNAHWLNSSNDDSTKAATHNESQLTLTVKLPDEAK